MDKKGFVNPDNILRPAPFWAINSAISPEEAARQITDMISVGLSGGFFHSRHGLLTDYMSDEWFEAMRAALKAAKDNGGYLWLYDEDLWPSGNAGGQVAGKKDEYRATHLLACLVAAGEDAPELNDDQIIKYCYAIKCRKRLNLNDFESVPLDKIDGCREYERLFMIRSYAPKTGWWSGESYSNLLNPEAMREFINLTHEVYAKELGEDFGKTIPGIFTDEPQLAYSPTSLPWYDGIPELYGKWMGRDFESDLPFLFFDGAQSRKIRLLVNRAINRQFLEAYSKQLFDWCDEHGIEHTGHYVPEDSIQDQIKYNAGSIMGHYRYQHAPGIDHLCRQVKGFKYGEGMLLTVKQVSSAARQLGRKRVLDEIFGVSRHTNTFEDFKWLGDFDLALGANFFVPHLTWYSAKGRRKRDYPPVWNYQQTYWHELNPLNDYFSRVAYALTRGEAAVDIVMLHPVDSATAARRIGVEARACAAGNTQRVPLDLPTEDLHVAEELDGYLRKSLDAILATGHDCDLGDEGYIEDMGRVSGDSFAIGEMSYKLVVVPPSTTWRPKTFELLKKYNANGGKIVILGQLPTELDCEDAGDQWEELAGRPNVWALPCSTREIQEAIAEIAPSSCTITDMDGRFVPDTYVHRRSDSDQEIVFIVNSSRDDARSYILTFKNAAGKQLAEWDALTGECETAEPLELGNDLRAEISLPPCGSLLLTLGGQIEPCEISDEEYEGHEHDESVSMTVLDGEFDFQRCEDNVLVLDRISVSYDGGKSFEPEDLEYRVRKSIADHFGTTPALEWQPWVAIRKHLFDDKGGKIVLRYKFTSDLNKPKSFAVIEDIEKGSLTVNGTAVDLADKSWHWDRAFGKVEITQLVKQGDNVMDFALDYNFLTEVEPAYIVGDFGVELVDALRGKIVAEPSKLKAGTWTDQGYPFYTGRMIYKTEFFAEKNANVFVRLVRPSGSLYKVRVNGKEAGEILWRPYEIDLTGFVRSGKNLLEIEVVSSLQNAWGPLHEQIGDDNSWCSPEAFEDDNILREQINVFPYGLLGGIEIVSF
ncbi:MAG: hypothetical protein ABFD83_13050 [Armatimonadota bacterium]